ncbi:MAG: S8 family serine peptidase [Euzebyales bacterium]|nr:S8 family serine peptidase [Euzebyales bacterium]
MLALPAAAASAAPATVASSSDRLGKHDRELLAQARADGRPRVTLLIAAEPGANREVASGLAGVGGRIRSRDDDVSYIRATVPTGKAEAAARLAGIEAVDLDEVIPLDDPRPEGSQPVKPQTPPGADTPNDNPYMPTGDTGASTFVKANPTWDGRGTTIGIVDTGVDLDHPSLQTTSTGERKIVDWVTATHPFDDNDPTWVSMDDQVSGSTLSYGDVTYTAPADKTYRIGLFDERDRRLGGELGNDVNRDGNPKGSSGIFAVLWDTDSNDVYVDADQDADFADEKAMTDYRVRKDVGTFGKDDPATAVRESMPFVVQTDGRSKVVNIGIVSGAHGSHVAGITAADRMFGGEMSGAAPGAKLVSVRVCLFIAGCTAHALIEGMTWVAQQGDVDVINMSIGGLPALNDGNNTRATIYNRLIEQYNVQMFISAGNSGPGLNTIGDPSAASKVMSVGSSITDETWRSNYGSDSAFADNLHYFTSRGPREDGGFKPQIVAPGSAVSTVPTWQRGGPVPGTYELPPGYAMFNGTSMASPQAAGAAALLVSAAKQAGVQSQPAQLRQAINSSARYIDRLRAFDQGNGLMDVAGAWELLKTNVKTVDITSAVKVNTVLSGFLKTPGVGQGIYDREGVTAGDSFTRRYAFTRTSGGSRAVTYRLAWVGDDGTFSSPSSVSLPLNKAVTLDVTVNPATAGAHAAILNLDDPATAGTDYQTMNVVVAAERFTAGNGYAVTKTGTVGRNQSESFFFAVPAGTPAFKVDFSGPDATAGTGQARFLRFHPFGLGFDSNSSLACYSPPVSGTCNPNSRTAANPQAGVWEVTVDARRTSDVENAPFTLTASVLGAKVSPNPDVIESATAGTSVAREYTLTNLFGTFTGRAVGTPLGSARRSRESIANLEQAQYLVNVAKDSTSLRATIGNPSDAKADLDLFVFNCTAADGSCKLAGQQADGDSEESVTIANPAAGTWKIIVDGYAVPAGTTEFDYLDVFANPAFGGVTVTDANASRPAGGSWTVPGAVTAQTAPADGRVLLGNVQVRTDGDVLVGSGDVVVQNVR